MSSDGKDPGAVWQGSAQTGWGGSAQQSYEEQDFAALPVDTDQQEVLYLSTPPLAEEENEQFEQDKPRARRFFASIDLLKQLNYYIPLVVIPLVLVVLACVITLPLIASGHYFIKPNGLLPIFLLLLAIGLVQGAAVYVAGANKGLWGLAIAGGFACMVLVSVFALWGPMMMVLALVVLVGGTVWLVRRYLQPVPEGYVDIVMAFGKYSRTLYPGFNMLLPWEKVQQPLNVGETQWICPVQRVQLSLDQDVVLRAAISYQLLPEDAYVAITQVNDWQDALRQILLTTIQEVATTFKTDDFLAWPRGAQSSSFGSRALPAQEPNDEARWDRINSAVQDRLRDKVALWGVQVNWVRIRDVNLVPHNAPIMDTEPVLTPEAVEERPARSEVPVAAGNGKAAKPQKSAGEVAKTPAPAPQAQPVTPVPAAQQKPNPPTPAKLPKEEVLVKAYKEVQSGNITDPDTIRAIAEKFDSIARDPQASQSVHFDAARAALNLYQQAQKYEEQFGGGPVYTDETRPDMGNAPSVR